MVSHPEWGVLPPRHGLFRLADHYEQRKIGATHGSIRSRIPLRTPSGAQTVESELEAMLVQQLQFSTYVYDLITQPIIRYTKDGQERRYSVDAIVYLTNTGCGAPLRYLIEVKRQDDLDKNAAEYRDRFEIARRFARTIDGEFRIMTEAELKTPYFQNTRDLQVHVTHEPSGAEMTAIGRALANGPADVGAVVSNVMTQGLSEADARDAVERAIVARLVLCDLNVRVSDRSRLSAMPADHTFRLDDDPFLRSLRSARTG